MKLLAKEDSHTIKTEAYVGEFTKEEVLKISNHTDRLLTAGYVMKIPKTVFNTRKTRLQWLSEIKSEIEVSIKFSAEMDFMCQPGSEKMITKKLKTNSLKVTQRKKTNSHFKF